MATKNGRLPHVHVICNVNQLHMRVQSVAKCMVSANVTATAVVLYDLTQMGFRLGVAAREASAPRREQYNEL